MVKIIDLGASRRFVLLSNRERNNRSAVEEQDQQLLSLQECVPRLDAHLCEGLGSLTGSPYYMAPEILIQATRYTDITGRSRSVLEDYEHDYRRLLAKHEWPLFHIGLNDLRRGWGIRADVWSWACTVQALLLRTLPEERRPSTSTISPFDFSFSKHREEMLEPLYEKSPEEENVPRFHQWCRALPLLIVRVTLEPATLPHVSKECSEWLQVALKQALRHQDRRPSADDICQFIETTALKSVLRVTNDEEVETLGSYHTTPTLSADSRSVSASSEGDGCPSTSESRSGSDLRHAVCTADIDTSSRASTLMSGFDMISQRPTVPRKEARPATIERMDSIAHPQHVETSGLPRPPLPCKLPRTGVSKTPNLPYWITGTPSSPTHWRNSSVPVAAMTGTFSKMRNTTSSQEENCRSFPMNATSRTRPSTGTKASSIRQSTLFATFRDKHDKLKSRLANPAVARQEPATLPMPSALSPKKLFRRLFSWHSSSPPPTSTWQFAHSARYDRQ